MMSNTEQIGNSTVTANKVRDAAAELHEAVSMYVANPQLEIDSDADKMYRRQIVDLANKVAAAAKDPADEWVDCLQQISVPVVNRLFAEWGVFDHIPAEGDTSYTDLAAAVDADVVLITRLGGVLVANGVLAQKGADRVAHTTRSRIFLKGEPTGLVYQLAWVNGFTVYASLPKYFETYGRKEPQTINHVPATFAYGQPEMGYYEMISHKPAMMQLLMKGMAPLEAKMPIAGIYDFTWLVERAKDPATADRALFVDVGGGKGHAITAIQAEFPGLPLSRFILQDRPEVLAAMHAMDLPEMREVRTMAIDFHQEQPVKGAVVYFIRRVLHNYPDAIDANILQKIAEVMGDDSRVLLQEDVMDNPPHHMAANLDLMMLGFGGKQRTLKMWEQVISAAGLRITNIVRGSGPWKSLSVIECVKTSK